MKVNYFSRNRKFKNKLNTLKSKRLIFKNNLYHPPLGIMLDSFVSPTEGFKKEIFSNNLNEDMYFYRISISVEKINLFFKDIIKIFPNFTTIVVERKSKDINRKYDIFLSDPDISKKEALKLFTLFDDLWIECGCIGFGILDENTGLEIFIDFHKTIEIIVPLKYSPFINKTLKKFYLKESEHIVFINELEHWHYSLHELVGSKNSLSFNYYNIINNIKYKYGFKIINENDSHIKVLPYWWAVSVKRLSKCKTKSLISTYYLIANTFEEMETIIDDEMKMSKIEYYYIHDYYNINPKSETDVFVTRKKNVSLEKYKFGIWGETKIKTNNISNISQYLLNKPYATSYKKSI